MSGSLGRVREGRGMSGNPIIEYSSGNRSDNEPGSVFTKRAAEAVVGVVSRQNETLGRNVVGIEEGREERPSYNLPLMEGQGHRAYWLLSDTLRYATSS